MFIGCCLVVSMLLHQQAQRLSLEEDSNLLSKVAFLTTADDQSQQLWWSLDFMYDRFKFHGEKRKIAQVDPVFHARRRSIRCV